MTLASSAARRTAGPSKRLGSGGSTPCAMALSPAAAPRVSSQRGGDAREAAHQHVDQREGHRPSADGGLGLERPSGRAT